jgi:hypothetical protein
MSRLDDLPPDQRATLSLLLRRHKSYAEVAELLSIQERAVHDRAHAALAVLAPREARELTSERREEIGDYLLSQRASVGARLATRTYLDGSPQARAWASAVAAALEPLAGEPLPEIPAGPPDASATAGASAADAVEESPTSTKPPASSERPASTSPLASLRPSASPRRDGSQGRSASPGSPPSSRVGGGLLLAALIAGVIVVVVLITGGGGGSHGSSAASATGTGSATTGTSTNAAKSGRASEDKRITLTAPDPSSKAVGVAEVLSEGSKRAFYLAAEHLPPSKDQGFFYAIWLYNSPTSHEALSKSPPVGADGRMQGGALLPDDAGKYRRMLVTKETNERPTNPGEVVLSGPFALH